MVDPSVRLTVLNDNALARPGLSAGHGLALLVEAAGTRVLFDTGPQGTVVNNAVALGRSLYPLSAVVLSHGHYDHTGGLAAVLQVAGPVKVVAQRGIFDETFSGPDPTEGRPIGLPLSRGEYEALGARFDLTEQPVPLGPIMTTTGHVPPLHLPPERRRGLWRRVGSLMLADDFRDEAALVATLPTCNVVITGCAHLGLANILCKVQTITPGRRPAVVLGGLHLNNASTDEVAAFAREAVELGVAALLPCHCTGDGATALLRADFAGTVTPLGTGTTVRIHADGRTEVAHARMLTDAPAALTKGDH